MRALSHAPSQALTTLVTLPPLCPRTAPRAVYNEGDAATKKMLAEAMMKSRSEEGRGGGGSSFNDDFN